MNKQRKKARREFLIWFESNICESSDYEYEKLSDNSLNRINDIVKRISKKYGVDSDFIDGILYDME